MIEDTYPVPVLRPKLYRPAAARDIVPLEDQLVRLEAGRDRPLTLVAAPAGYGKTTLISCWLDQTEGVRTWLTLDESDSDVRSFLSHLVAALRIDFPPLGHDLVRAISGATLPDSKVLAGLLANDLDDLDTPLIVAFDDYHLIRSAAVHEFIDCLAEHPPRGLHLVIITRRDPPLRSRSLRAGGRMTDVRIDDLRLRRDQTATFLRRVAGRSISEQNASRVHLSAEGWPAGLRLAAMALRRRSDIDGFVDELKGGVLHIEMFLLGEVLSQQRPEVQDRLRKSSILQRFCSPLVDSLIPGAEGDDPTSGREFTRILEREGMFVVPLDDHGEWYRYHHLFQGLLRGQLQAEASTPEIAGLHARAAEWLDRNGTLEEALHHYGQCDEPEGAERAILRHREELLEGEQWYRIGRCLDLVRNEILDRSIDLQLLAAHSADRRGRYVEMDRSLERAELLLGEPKTRDRLDDFRRGQLEMMRGALLAHLAQGQKAFERAQRALDLLPGEPSSDRAYALFILACGLQMTGRREEAHRRLGSEVESFPGASASFRGRLLQALGLVEWMSGDLTSLRRVATTGLEVGGREALGETTVWSRFFLGAAHYHLGESSEAEDLLTPIVEDPFGPSLHIHILASEVMARVEQARGNFLRARKISESIARHLLKIGNESYREYVQAIQAGLALRQGRRSEAIRWAHSFEPGTRWAGYHFSEPELTAAKVLLAEGTAAGIERAGTILAGLGDFYSSSFNGYFGIETLALQALHAEVVGDRERAVDRLGEAVSLALPGGYIRIFADLGAELAPLLHRLDLDDEGLEYVGGILSAMGDDAERQPSGTNDTIAQPAELVEVLTRRELEILSLLALHLSNQEIGDRLCISLETVKHHNKNLFGKLEVHNRRAAVAKARGLGLLVDESVVDTPPL